ncbi:MAG: hypothetical protein HFH68_09210 [Lachnospiraceae bacterium]|nr:hypothetical protein [Lachnospiraceae bacterium]
MQERVKGTVKDSIFCNLFKIKKYLLQLYLAQTYHEYFKENGANLYGSKKVVMPEPELYVVYTGSRKKKQEYISLSEEFFGRKDTGIELKAKVIYDGKNNDIISQYVNFTKVYNKQVKKHGKNKKAVLETIRICKDKNLLKEYLESKEKEVVGIMMALFDQEEVFNTYVKSEVREAEKKAEKKAAIKLLKTGKCSIGEIKEIFSKLDDDDILKIEQELMQNV